MLSETTTIHVTPLFIRNYDSTKRIVINRGGTRSSKSYSLAQLFICELLTGGNKVLSVVRKSLPALRATAMRDVISILKTNQLYEDVKHNKTENSIEFGTNTLEFFSLDDEQKVRGRKRAHLWLNEANECSFDDWQQLIFRTTGRAFLDFNPDDTNCWINTELEQKRAQLQADVEVITSTYRDNSFLDANTIREIEFLQKHDPEYWSIFGMGEYGKISGLVFKNFLVVNQLPDGAKQIGLGLDFGFTNDPSALVQVCLSDGKLFVHELFYQTGLTNMDIAEMLARLNLERNTEIIADAAEPKSIEEIHRAGFAIKPAQKGGDSIKLSIDILRRYTLCITASSTNLLKELRAYKWQTDKNGIPLNTPIDFNNHAIDALRYVALNKLKRPLQAKYVLR